MNQFDNNNCYSYYYYVYINCIPNLGYSKINYEWYNGVIIKPVCYISSEWAGEPMELVEIFKYIESITNKQKWSDVYVKTDW